MRDAATPISGRLRVPDTTSRALSDMLRNQIVMEWMQGVENHCAYLSFMRHLALEAEAAANSYHNQLLCRANRVAEPSPITFVAKVL
jgi:hypothetical protein